MTIFDDASMIDSSRLSTRANLQTFEVLDIKGSLLRTHGSLTKLKTIAGMAIVQIGDDYSALLQECGSKDRCHFSEVVGRLMGRLSYFGALSAYQSCVRIEAAGCQVSAKTLYAGMESLECELKSVLRELLRLATLPR
jgi:hypothetical protein